MATTGPADMAPLDEERLARVAQNVPIGLFEADAQGGLTFVSSQWCALTGLDPDRAIGRGWLASIHPDDRSRVEHAWDDAVAHARPLEAACRLARNNEHLVVRVSMMPVTDAAGLIELYAGALMDVTEIADADDRIEQFRTLNETTNNLRFVLDSSNALSANLDVDAVCATLAEIAITSVADWCFIVLKNAEGGYDTRAIAHRDPSRVAHIRQFRDRYPVQNGSPLDRAIRRNAPMLIPTVAERDLRMVARDPEHLAVLASLEMHSAMMVPISTDDGHVYGGITIASSESARAYGPRDPNGVGVPPRTSARGTAAVHR